QSDQPEQHIEQDTDGIQNGDCQINFSVNLSASFRIKQCAARRELGEQGASQGTAQQARGNAHENLQSKVAPLYRKRCDEIELRSRSASYRPARSTEGCAQGWLAPSPL